MAGSLGDVHGIIDIEHADPSSGFKYYADAHPYIRYS